MSVIDTLPQAMSLGLNGLSIFNARCFRAVLIYSWEAAT